MYKGPALVRLLEQVRPSFSLFVFCWKAFLFYFIYFGIGGIGGMTTTSIAAAYRKSRRELYTYLKAVFPVIFTTNLTILQQILQCIRYHHPYFSIVDLKDSRNTSISSSVNAKISPKFDSLLHEKDIQSDMQSDLQSSQVVSKYSMLSTIRLLTLQSIVYSTIFAIFDIQSPRSDDGLCATKIDER